MNGLFNILAALLLGGAVIWVGYAITREDPAERTAENIDEMRQSALSEAEELFADNREAGANDTDSDNAEAEETARTEEPVEEADTRLAQSDSPVNGVTGMESPYTPGVARTQMERERNDAAGNDDSAGTGAAADAGREDEAEATRYAALQEKDDDSVDEDGAGENGAGENGADARTDGRDDTSSTAGLNNPGGQMRRVDKPDDSPSYSEGKPVDKPDDSPSYTEEKPVDKPDSERFYTEEKPTDKPDSEQYYTEEKPVDKPDTEEYYTEGKPVDKPDSERFYTEDKPIDKPDSDRFYTEGKPLDKPDTDRFYTETTPLPDREYAGIEHPCLRADGTPYTGPGTVQNPFADENPCLEETTPVPPIIVQRDVPEEPEQPVQPPVDYAEAPKKCVYRPGTYTAEPIYDGRGDGWMADFGCFSAFNRPGFGPSPTPEDSGSDYI